MKIVRFNNGKWAIQKGRFFKQYKSKHSDNWWFANYAITAFCLFDTKEQALNHINYNNLTSSLKIIEEFDLTKEKGDE